MKFKFWQGAPQPAVETSQQQAVRLEAERIQAEAATQQQNQAADEGAQAMQE